MHGGCKWTFLVSGLQGQVIEHPLDDWSKLNSLRWPDPEAGIPTESGPIISWGRIEAMVRSARERDYPVIIGMPHGFLFQRLYYLRGFRNLMLDFIKKPSSLYELIDRLTEYYLELVRKAVRLNPDIIAFGDDLGTQDRLTVSPRAFREFILPAYKRIFGFVRSAGVHVYLHSDGHIMEIMDDLIGAGISVINPQVRVNGLDNLKAYKGRVCIDADVDRQVVLPFGTPRDVEEHIREIVLELGSRKGGLGLIAGVYPDVPLQNIEALCQAMEKYMCYYSRTNAKNGS